MKLRCQSCDRAIWLDNQDVEDIDVDGANELTCPFCERQALRATLSAEKRRLREGRAERGVYE